jgi:hypothetical protein
VAVSRRGTVFPTFQAVQKALISEKHTLAFFFNLSGNLTAEWRSG